jgi:hypothetical protein
MLVTQLSTAFLGNTILGFTSNKTLLEEATVELFDDKNVTIRCILYNLTIYVKVIDYFGQPIPKANVTLERNGVKIVRN